MITINWITLLCTIILFIMIIRLAVLITRYKDIKICRNYFGMNIPDQIVDSEISIIENYLKLNQPNKSNFNYQIYSLFFENIYFLDKFKKLLDLYGYDFNIEIKIEEVNSTIEFIYLTDKN